MSTPFSTRMDDDVRDELMAHAETSDVSSSRLVNRYVKEGLRMDKHPAITFRTMPQGRRSATLLSRPGVQVIDVIGTWQAERKDAAATATYFHISDGDVHAVLRYYADYNDEIDGDLKAHLDAQQVYKSVLRAGARTRRRVGNA